MLIWLSILSLKQCTLEDRRKKNFGIKCFCIDTVVLVLFLLLLLKTKGMGSDKTMQSFFRGISHATFFSESDQRTFFLDPSLDK